jgi:drug/metabolite transporter (DMT)-like permease
MNAERLAIHLMIGQSLLFSAETATIHQLGSRVAMTQLALIRAAAGIVLAAMLARNLGLAVMRTRQLPLQLLRGVVSLLYLWVMIYAFGHLPYADATAISFTQTAYIPLFSWLILAEQATASRWAAVALGIAGALLIAKPVFAGWSGAYLVALLGAALNALAFVLNRYLQRADSEATTMFYSNLLAALANLPFLATGPMPGSELVPWLVGVSLLGPVGMYLGIMAVRHATPPALGPFTLLRLVVSVLGGIIVFRELPDMATGIGAVLVLLSCMLPFRGCVMTRATKNLRLAP